MPTISSFYGILIRMFYNDHEPPHFHALYGEFQATIAIDELRVAGRGTSAARSGFGVGLGRVASRRITGKLAAGSGEERAQEDYAVEIMEAVCTGTSWK